MTEAKYTKDPVLRKNRSLQHWSISVLRWKSPANEYSSFCQIYLSRRLSIPSCEDGKRASFQNCIIFFEYKVMDKVQKPST